MSMSFSILYYMYYITYIYTYIDFTHIKDCMINELHILSTKHSNILCIKKLVISYISDGLIHYR